MVELDSKEYLERAKDELRKGQFDAAYDSLKVGFFCTSGGVELSSLLGQLAASWPRISTFSAFSSCFLRDPKRNWSPPSEELDTLDGWVKSIRDNSSALGTQSKYKYGEVLLALANADHRIDHSSAKELAKELKEAALREGFQPPSEEFRDWDLDESRKIDWRLAATAYRLASEADPTDVSMESRSVYTFERAGTLTNVEAFERLGELAREHKESPWPPLFMGKLKCKGGDNDAAREYFKSVTEAHPEHGESWLERAILEIDNPGDGRLDADDNLVLGWLDKAVQGGAGAEAQFQRAKLFYCWESGGPVLNLLFEPVMKLLGIGDKTGRALVDLGELLNLTPYHRDGRVLRAEIYARAGELGKALSDLEVAMSIPHPNRHSLFSLRGRIKVRLGDYEGGIRDLRTCLSRSHILTKDDVLWLTAAMSKLDRWKEIVAELDAAQIASGTCVRIDDRWQVCAGELHAEARRKAFG